MILLKLVVALALVLWSVFVTAAALWWRDR